MDIKLAMDRAKVKLMTLPNSVFVSTVLFSLKLIITDQIPTAGTDGKEILVNPTWFLKLDPEERVGLLFHETFHVVYNHIMRGKDLIQDKYNIAGDHVINLEAKRASFVIPKGGYCDKKYKGMSTLQVYDALPDDCADRGGGGIGPDIIPMPDNATPAEIEAAEVNLTNVLLKAATKSKLEGDAPGTVPGEIAVMLDELLNPKLPWNVILQNYLASYAKEDYTWTRPNKRFMPDFYLPSAHSESMGHIAVAVDTSCSVTDKEFTAFRSEIAGMKEMLDPELISVLSFDTSIKNIDEVHKDDDFADVTFKGRGGTDISDTWKWIDEHKPLVTIIFSDGEFGYPKYSTGSDVIWVIVNNSNKKDLPFGISNIHMRT